MTGRSAASRRGAAVLGSPIAHSLSPVLHRAAYDALGLSDWSYRAIECTVADLDATLAALDAETLAGASLTMPLKRAVMSLLGSVDDVARQVGAANTVVFGDDGWHGANTDVPGMVASLAPRLLSDVKGQRACVFGAGATAASGLAAVSQLGFAGADVFARRPEAAAELAALAESVNLDFDVHAWAEISIAGSAPLVISTTPAGSTSALAAHLPEQLGVLFDVVYAPWPTPLAQAWQAGGGAVVGGLELLVEQAALQVQLMTGQLPPVDVMREAGYAALGRRA